VVGQPLDVLDEAIGVQALDGVRHHGGGRRHLIVEASVLVVKQDEEALTPGGLLAAESVVDIGDALLSLEHGERRQH